MKPPKFLAFDLANTLIHKPSIFAIIRKSLLRSGVDISKRRIVYAHRILTETVAFPDITSKEFYLNFNERLLILLGVPPSQALINDIYERCKNQPWVPFQDIAALGEYNHKKIILSNFSYQITGIVDAYFPKTFDRIFASHKSCYRKPDVRFYQECIEALGCEPRDILYVGDSPLLDLIPSLQCGMRSLLIDRDGLFARSAYRISSLHELSEFL